MPGLWARVGGRTAQPAPGSRGEQGATPEDRAWRMQRQVGAVARPGPQQQGCGRGSQGSQQQEEGAPGAAQEDTKESVAPLKETTRVQKVKCSQNGIIRTDGITEQMEQGRNQGSDRGAGDPSGMQAWRARAVPEGRPRDETRESSGSSVFCCTGA